MNKITYYCPVCNSWVNKNFTEIGKELGACPRCSALFSLEFKKISFVWRWDIFIPENWVYGDWTATKLFSSRVPLVILRCLICGEWFRVSPSFLIAGTTLTLSAVAFVAFAYETSGLTWRDLPEKFFDGRDKIAHSTLYRAVHKAGKLLESDQLVADLRRRYLPAPKRESVIPLEGFGWHPPKSLFTHTIARELGARRFVKELLPGKSGGFTELFHRHLDNWNRIFTGWQKPLPLLYNQRSLKSTRLIA